MFAFRFVNILYTNFHEGAGIGGHTVYILNLARALSGRHRISIASPETSSLYRLAADIPGVEVHALDFPTRVSRLPRAALRLRALLQRGRFDLVHVNGSSDHRLVMCTAGMGGGRSRVVFTKHNDQPAHSFGTMLRARLATDHVIAVCEHVARQLVDTPYARCGVTTVPNGIDTGHFQPAPASEREAARARWVGPQHADKLVLGSHAGTDDYKAWVDMALAAARLPAELRQRLHIVIAGDPPADDLLAQVRDAGMTAQFTYAGRLDDVRPLVSAFDVGFVLSYRIETISFACREMMAMGLPVIVSRHAGLPENITPLDDGWVVPPRDPAAVADVLAAILQGRADLKKMGGQARAKSERAFGLATFVDATEAVYDKVLRGEG